MQNNNFSEVFALEIDGWCYGISNYPGEIYPGLVHRIIREVKPAFDAAIANQHVFEVSDIASRLSKAAKYLISEKEIAFSIMSHLPNPMQLDERGKRTLAQIVNSAELKYSGALARLQRRWHLEENLRSAA